MPLISNRETVAVELEAGHPRIVKDSRGSIGNKDRRIASQFKRRKPEYFIVGRVFKVLWPELQGNSSKGGVSLVSQKVYGQKVYAKIRYFVVVNVNEGSCWCLPISTYSGQGVGKLGEVKKYHAIIYTGDDCPAPTPLEIPVHGSGEEPMGHPIAVQVKDADNKLDPMSRINFQKIYTVETNVKVYDFGRVVDDNGSLSSLRWQFNHALLNVSNDQLPSERIIAGGTAGRREKEKIKEEEEEQEEEEGYAQYGDEAR
ncbi:hypothetical protein EJ05DRAFT_326877 [Pseudovirgaria hyperparasitica]|uniref:DUF6590 domain-containing protein n=1 Tax=Pseudovirgaria hyperparasitica TaxID=470096 RepID=A0A6A6WA78_9PEZI|nr:uncharacterized protein EJ05DRAFT_326877 [Pseudovirgaria hyperparasitica]KAF2758934.1 hypothetical protein EJ05DRAFT_326877 [Pseudovirgaria hyperparasitica]